MGREERGEFEGEFQADVVVAQVSLIVLSKGQIFSTGGWGTRPTARWLDR